jgi:carboxyl-terminal processing protease
MTKSRLIVIVLTATAFAAIPVVVAVGARTSSPSGADLGLIEGVMQIVELAYVHQVAPDQLTEDALKGMLTRLDPHSDYMNEKEYKDSQADISGQFGGLGIEISEEGGVPRVISPIDDTPAARAGLQPGDLIVSVDGQSTHGMDLTKIVRTLRGSPGSQVTLSISRGTNAPFDVTLTRSTIYAQSVKSKLEPNGIGYLRISEFGGSTPKDFKQALESMKQQVGGQLMGVVLDLRNDPGGLLSSAVAVAGDFVDGGTIVTVRGRSQSDDRTLTAPGNGNSVPGAAIVVLINGASASASEIVAGALQDRHRATIVGTQSFGKGSVQTIIPLKGHGALRLTTALYYTPSGRSIQDQGISPDVVVEAPKDEQIAGALPRESTLQGAFQNPGSLQAPPSKGQDAQAPANELTYSAPIEGKFIGTPQDAQLNAALSYLNQSPDGPSGQR